MYVAKDEFEFLSFNNGRRIIIIRNNYIFLIINRKGETNRKSRVWWM